jgi:hypothetical protein
MDIYGDITSNMDLWDTELDTVGPLFYSSDLFEK